MTCVVVVVVYMNVYSCTCTCMYVHMCTVNRTWMYSIHSYTWHTCLGTCSPRSGTGQSLVKNFTWSLFSHHIHVSPSKVHKVHLGFGIIYTFYLLNYIFIQKLCMSTFTSSSVDCGYYSFNFALIEPFYWFFLVAFIVYVFLIWLMVCRTEIICGAISQWNPRWNERHCQIIYQ